MMEVDQNDRSVIATTTTAWMRRIDPSGFPPSAVTDTTASGVGSGDNDDDGVQNGNNTSSAVFLCINACYR
jgi:hypothetical protein